MLSLKAKHLWNKLINDMFDAELLIMFLMFPSCSSCSLRKHFGISQSRALFRCPFIRICLSLYYPRRSSVPRIPIISPLSEGFRTTEEGGYRCLLAGLPKLCEDIGDVFLRIDLVQPRRSYARHEGPGGLGSLLRIAEKEVLPCHHEAFHRPFTSLSSIRHKFVSRR